MTEQLFNNQEVHNELLLLDSFDKKLSITDNATNLLMSGKLDVDTFFRLQNAVNNGADDFSLSYLFANNLWKEIADNTIGISYPTQKMMEAFNIKIEYRDVINPAVGQDNRTLANGTCASSGCGQYGAPRIGRDTEHQGTDYLILPDGYVLVVMDGAIYRTNSSKIPSRALPSYAIENKNTGMRSLVLYNNLDPSIKDNTKVQQGGVVGRPISQSEFDRVYNTVKDKKGNIIKTLKPGDKGYTVPHLHFERMRLDDWSNKSDTLPIVFPNKIPEKLPNKK